jgi:hypothetical protein
MIVILIIIGIFVVPAVIRFILAVIYFIIRSMSKQPGCRVPRCSNATMAETTSERHVFKGLYPYEVAEKEARWMCKYHIEMP